MALIESADVEGVREQIKVSEKNRELEALKAIQPNVIQWKNWEVQQFRKHSTELKGTFRRGKVLYMLFPRADGGKPL